MWRHLFDTYVIKSQIRNGFRNSNGEEFEEELYKFS